MLIRAIKTLDWVLTKYASGIQPTALTKIINLTGILTKGTGNTLNLKVLEDIGEQLKKFNFKEEVIRQNGN